MITFPRRWIEQDTDTVSVWEGPARDTLAAYGFFGESRGGTPETRKAERSAFVLEQETRARGIAGELTAEDVTALTAEIAALVVEGDTEVAERRESTLREYALRAAYLATPAGPLRDVLEGALRVQEVVYAARPG